MELSTLTVSSCHFRPPAAGSVSNLPRSPCTPSERRAELGRDSWNNAGRKIRVGGMAGSHFGQQLGVRLGSRARWTASTWLDNFLRTSTQERTRPQAGERHVGGCQAFSFGHTHASAQLGNGELAVGRASQYANVASLQSELQMLGRKDIQGGRPVKRRRRACAQLADPSQTVGLQSKAGDSKCVLVVGATGGVGQLVVAALLEKGVTVRAVLRDGEKARALFGQQDPEKFQVHVGDTRQPGTISSSLFEGVTHVICCTGTTAFPSKRWDGDNGPEKTDWEGVRNLVEAIPKSVEHVVLVSSIGVTKSNELPWNIMNLFGVLKYKKMGEDFLRESGLPYTIIRPGRLTDGPYTSYDLNTLLKATAGTRRDVIIGQGDTLVGEASRVVVAEACIQALEIPCTIGQTYEVNSVEGEGPGKDTTRWETLFKSALKS